ncbi:MAG TPA: hypothetical protein VF665_06360 [Longimicrobium sp.]|jgi:hypothetical protein|uniref:hypothetical protein n=1 Tax=Longimicrobium sp. TaxID=2029185 RepID=UPI002EDA57EE
MNSPLEKHEVRLRGLQRMHRRKRPAPASARPERMNSPLERHKVRLRGLHRRDSLVQRATAFAKVRAGTLHTDISDSP